MIHCIDLVAAEAAEQFLFRWHRAINKQAQQPGFIGAKLHSVYKQLNRDGYALISVVSWEDDQSLDQARRERPLFSYLSDEQFARDSNRYHVINQGGDAALPPRDGDIVITNPYRISAEEAPRHAEMWEQSKRHMQGREGFVDAVLYQCRSPHGDYYFFSRARWRSEALFMSQFEGRDFKTIIAPFEGIFSICLSRTLSSIDAEACSA